ncbi:MAG: FHA domain-containing protein, partial [Pyrinomonadaceae bacterium]
MPKAKLIIDGTEIPLEDGITTIGRAPDNKICLAEDSNVSRYHAEIECKDGRFWLTDVGSRNGTTINGISVKTTVELFDGDLIVLGGTSQIKFHIEKSEPETEKPQDTESNFASESSAIEAPKSEIVEQASVEVSKKSSFPLILMGFFVALMMIFVAVLAFFLYGSFAKPACEVKAKIVSPESGDLIDKETEINIEVQNGECLERLIVLLEDEPVAIIERQPFVATLNPADFPEFADGLEHSLKLVVEDSNGKRSSADAISIALETASIKK